MAISPKRILADSPQPKIEPMLSEFSGVDFKALLEAVPHPYMLLDRELRYVWANAAYLQVTGRDFPSLAGRHIFEAFPPGPHDPDDASAALLRASLTRVLERCQPDTLALIRYAIPTADGMAFEERYWSATHTPVLDEQGRVRFILQQTNDVTELQRLREAAKGTTGNEPRGALATIEAGLFQRAQAVQEENRTLDAERRRLRELFRQVPGFIAVLRGPEHVFELANDAYCAIVGRSDIIDKPVVDALPEIREQGFLELLDGVLTSGRPFVGHDMQVRLQRQPGQPLEELFLDFVYQPIVDLDGTVSGIFVQGNDVTRRRRSEEALRESEARARLQLLEVETLYRTAPIGLGLFDRDLRFLRVNEALAAINGPSVEEHLGRYAWDVVPTLREAAEPLFRRVFDTGEPVLGIELHGSTPAQPSIERDWIEDFYPLKAADGTVIAVGVIVREVTEQRRLEERERLLTAELRHRLKNMFAMVEALAAQTAKSAPSVPEFQKRFIGRIRTLAAAQDLLAIGPVNGAVALSELVSSALAPFVGTESRMRVALVDSPIAAHVASNLALALHELATNATKYGALSVPGGWITLTASLDASDAGRELCLEWREAGGPVVRRPQRQGFGTRLLERVIAGQHQGRVALAWEETGLVCRIYLRIDG
ncbi:PAS domain-containing protein [Azospirillum soli]|uniref:PAS domain-containing protein n=1 Tax=Azospirillum soli TaxID=1304799 RepID=UPI001AE23E62|nr:PAS domain-containing protein [Azospirillum soli]MBP2316182.1 PAS domain S-box-containing protein [Azospirillum soli]